MDQARTMIVWALLMPLSAHQLTEYARAMWQKKYGWIDLSESSWEIIPGKATYSALVDYEPGSEGTDESLAEEFSRTHPGIVYLLRFHEDLQVVWMYEQGRFTQTLSESPATLADQLQCPLPGITTPENVSQTTYSVCVVEGATAEAVAHALGFSAPPQGPFHIEQTKNGVIIFSERGGAAIFLHELSEALPDAIVYRVAREPNVHSFSVLIVKGETDIGIFERPEAEEQTIPRLDSVKGETVPAKIAAALGIPLALLDLDGAH